MKAEGQSALSSCCGVSTSPSAPTNGDVTAASPGSAVRVAVIGGGGGAMAAALKAAAGKAEAARAAAAAKKSAAKPRR